MKTKPIRVLLASHSHLLEGGAEKSLLEIAKSLEEDKSFQVKVALPHDGSFKEELIKQKIDYQVINYGWAASRQKYFLKLETLAEEAHRPLLKIHGLIKEFSPDIVITNSSVIPWFAYCSKVLGIPHIWFVRERIKTSSDVDRFYFPNNASYLEKIEQLSSMILVNSKNMHNYYKKLGVNTSVITPAMDKEITNYTNINHYSRNRKLRLIIYGSIRQGKGQLEVVKAVKILRSQNLPFHLTIMGSAEDRAYYKKLKSFISINNLGKDISFIGAQTNPYRTVAQNHICIVASSDESFGRVAIESMLLGKTIIASDVGGNLETVESEKTGLHYRHAEPQSLADKIIYLYDNPGKLNSLALCGYKEAKSKYIERSSSATLKEIFRDVLRHPLPLHSDWMSQILFTAGTKLEETEQILEKTLTLNHKKNLEILRLRKLLSGSSPLSYVKQKVNKLVQKLS